MSLSRRFATACAAFPALLLSASAHAHSFGQQYTLPIPIWMYLYGAAAALVVSFLVVGYFVTVGPGDVRPREYDLSRLWTPSPRTAGWIVGTLRCLSVGALALTIIAGFWGTAHPYRNINMTLFWVVFVLGFTYLTALIGNWFAVLNPFRILVNWMERLKPDWFEGRWRYPEALAYWPALLLYMAFIWIELFGRTTPFALATALSVYTAINIGGAWLVGRTAWFERCEFFGVFLRLVAKMAPVRCESRREGAVTGLYLRPPFVGLIQQRPVPLSLLVFVLFMLASTAFDGLHKTAVWIGAFWTNLYQLLLIPLYGDTTHITYPMIQKFLLAYQSGALLLSPFVYLLVYTLCLWLAKIITGNRVALKTLLLSFAFCLIPIAFAYHFTHYYTLLQIQGAQMIRLISDPLGIGWDLFATRRMAVNVVPEMGVVWHMQVLLIVLGHVISVYLAHLQALKVFPDRRSAILSQLPTLLLMVAFTAFGLWVLSLPLDSGAMTD